MAVSECSVASQTSSGVCHSLLQSALPIQIYFKAFGIDSQVLKYHKLVTAQRIAAAKTAAVAFWFYLGDGGRMWCACVEFTIPKCRGDEEKQSMQCKLAYAYLMMRVC